ncbi:mechanosensitive ion channel family protein [[Limnothrix rosea] IAM M-220]|uniref:mechanosensitive ion channel family protein n=1 Tax=[Limnothrix rosea] IAM M-220 TaxID=454133 RepID=UPI00095ECF2C|nr:mechanosensitive ion channel family protein [[Limnothrix rosea] IAM M-220]OKH18898.1 mechanosensitive ion channel protein MscS [[Limnothrix rosea] IAM M-220]
MSELLRDIVTKLEETFDPDVLSSQIASGIVNFSVALITFLVFYLVWRVVQKILVPTLKKSRIDKTSSNFLSTIAKFSILTFGLLQALSAIGINMTAIMTSLGVVGITVGFAARDAMSNLISGLLIFWDRPFVIDDLIEIDHFYGRVEKITLRSTRVVTPDGKMLAIPNSKVINSTVISYSNFPHLRLDIDVSVAVYESIDHTREILLDLVECNPDFMKIPPPRVVVTALNDYNIALQLQVWLLDERTHLLERFDLRECVFNALTKAGVDMPFETIKITPITLEKGDRLN